LRNRASIFDKLQIYEHAGESREQRTCMLKSMLSHHIPHLSFLKQFQ